MKDNRIITIHRKNGGVSAARNTGLDIANGEYIAFVDADDYVGEDFILNLYNAINRTEDIGISVSDMIYEGEREGVFASNIDDTICSADMINALLLGSYTKGWMCNKLYRRTIIQEKRFDENLLYLEDLEFNLRILCNTDEKVSFSATQDYHYVISSQSSSHNKEKRIIGIEQFHKAINYLPDNEYLIARYINNYMKQLTELASMTSDKYTGICKRNISFIKHNYWKCQKLLSKNIKKNV